MSTRSLIAGPARGAGATTLALGLALAGTAPQSSAPAPPPTLPAAAGGALTPQSIQAALDAAYQR
jgi:hypothetical protein